MSHYAILLQQWNGRNMASGEANQRVWPYLFLIAGVQLGSVTFCGVADLGVYLFHGSRLKFPEYPSKVPGKVPMADHASEVKKYSGSHGLSSFESRKAIT